MSAHTAPHYYNEIDPFAAQWLRNLIAAGHLPAGDVDERSIVDVKPSDLKGYTQCHFFAGIGGWPLALRMAGWSDDRPVWTGSCPCQPLSAAGQRKGHADERHLWPAFHALITECRPPTVFGEQVASSDGREWFAGIRADLEDMGYACGGADLCAASCGAPHIRQRIYWVAESESEQRDGGRQARRGRRELADGGDARGLADALPTGRAEGRTVAGNGSATSRGAFIGLADALRDGDGDRSGGGVCSEAAPIRVNGSAARPSVEPGICGSVDRMAHPNGRNQSNGRLQRSREHGFWSQDAIAISCTDGKRRRVPAEPSFQPLAPGFSEQLVRLRAIEMAGWKEIVTHGNATETDPDEVLRRVRQGVCEAHDRKEASGFGVLQQLHAPALLLDFLLCVDATRDGSANGSRVTQARHEALNRIVRGVRRGDGNLRASRQRQSDGQQPGEPTDALLALSLVLARHAEAHQSQARDTNAASSRLGLLRAYGNAIVPALGAAFITAFLAAQKEGRAEARPEISKSNRLAAQPGQPRE